MASIELTIPFTVARESDIFRTLAGIDLKQRPGEKGRTYLHEERWSICRFLSAMVGDPCLEYPLTLIHDDKPDFRLQCGERRIGIEVTRATHPDYAWAHARAYNLDGGVVECSFFRPRHSINRQIPTKKAKPPINSFYGELVGPGWLGNEAEDDWTDIVSEAIEKKTEALTQSARFDSDWLLIRDATPCNIVLDVHEAAPMLKQKLSAYWTRIDRFAAIFVLSGEHVFEFTASDMRSGLVAELWN